MIKTPVRLRPVRPQFIYDYDLQQIQRQEEEAPGDGNAFRGVLFGFVISIILFALIGLGILISASVSRFGLWVWP